MKGRKPSTVKADGNIRHMPKAPAYLSPEAKAEWRRIVPLLVERRILADADLGSLENYCIATGQVRRCEKQLAKEGMTYVTRLGERRANPLVKIMHDAATRARLLAAELGATPVSRSRANVSEAAGDDDEAADLGL